MKIYRLADHYPRSDVKAPDIEHGRLVLVPPPGELQVDAQRDTPLASGQAKAASYNPVGGEAA